METFSISGRAGKDAEFKQINEKSYVVNFSVAIDESYKDKDGNKVEKTKWVECDAWNNGLAKLIKKGDFVSVKGTAEAKAYQPKDATEPVAKLVCKVDDLEFASFKKD